MTEQGSDFFSFSLVMHCGSQLLGQDVKSLAAEGADIDCFFHYLNMGRVFMLRLS